MTQRSDGIARYSTSGHHAEPRVLRELSIPRALLQERSQVSINRRSGRRSFARTAVCQVRTRLPSDISFVVARRIPGQFARQLRNWNRADRLRAGAGRGQSQYVCFYPDGSSRDSLGNYNSGVVYLTRPADTIYASRAITVWGATGRVRGWRLVQQAGVPIWMQQ